uniref:Uncharacterized protein n=1 Tax=Meloidogyne javanica TaxID=6303 RepID=A0A915MFE3_MELJA
MYPSPQHLFQYQRQQQPSDYRQQQQYAADGHYLQQPQYNSHYQNSFQPPNKWQNEQKLEDDDSKEENNFLSKQNSNNRQYPQRVHFDPNNNLPYLYDRQQQKYNQKFYGGYNNHLNGQNNPSSFGFENEADSYNSPYTYGNQQRPFWNKGSLVGFRPRGENFSGNREAWKWTVGDRGKDRNFVEI